MNFVPSSVKAEDWGISQRRVAIFCKEGRVPGAELIGNRWFLPIDAEKPGDPRKATAGYEELLEYITNVYYVLMTRGIKGTYLYVCDHDLREYLSQYIEME